MSKRAYKTYTKEFKVEAIRLADQSDQPMTQVARKLGLRVNQVYKWTKQLEEKQDDAFSGKQTATDKDAKIQRLNKTLAASQEEKEFLKKTAVSSAPHGGIIRQYCLRLEGLEGLAGLSDVSTYGSK